MLKQANSFITASIQMPDSRSSCMYKCSTGNAQIHCSSVWTRPYICLESYTLVVNNAVWPNYRPLTDVSNETVHAELHGQITKHLEYW